MGGRVEFSITGRGLAVVWDGECGVSYCSKPEQ